MPNWAEQVTAIATAVSAIGLLSAIGRCGWLVRALRLEGQLSGPPGWTICPCTFSP